MKVIIDISEKTISHIRSDYGHGCKAIYDEDRDKIVDAIYHGIPLDDVRAEIDEQYDRVHPYNIYVAEGLEMALEIINIYNPESEDT